MPRYFLHLRDGIDIALDEEGNDFSSIEDLQAAVLRSARDCIAADAHTGTIDLRQRIDAENENGRVIHSLPFAEAVTII